MMHTGVLSEPHSEVITDGAYDHYGLQLATCSADQRIKIWALDESTGTWCLEDEWKAHDARICNLSWAHPEYGCLLASGSFDCTTRIWAPRNSSGRRVSDSSIGLNSTDRRSTSSWTQLVALREAKGSVRAVAFAPPVQGPILATLATDNILRIYDGGAAGWGLRDELDLAHGISVSATLDGVSATLAGSPIVASGSAAGGTATPGAAPLPGRGGGRIEADGGWTFSWCPERLNGLVLAVACGRSSVVRIIHVPSGIKRAQQILTLEREPPSPYSITSVSWAPALGRTHHCVATGGRDGHVRIWKVASPDVEGDDTWNAQLLADFDDHKAGITGVEWNCTGTVLSSSGYDGRIRLWKVSLGNVWRFMGYVTGETVDLDIPEGAPEEEQDD